MTKTIFTLCITLVICLATWSANAATSIPFTISTSEDVNVTGTPRIAVDVGGVTRYAAYTSGTGTSSLTFTYTMVAGDVDLDGVTLTSPMQLNGGTIKDLNGNDATLTFTVPNTSNVKVNYPSLGMDFVADADGRYTLNGTVYNDVTSFLTATSGAFTRAVPATTYAENVDGTLTSFSANTPRITNKGLLVEGSSTNLLLRSTDLNLAPWTSSAGGGITANATSDPIGGGATAEKIIENGINNQHIWEQTTNVNTSTNYTFSVFLKGAERGWAWIGFFNPTGYGDKRAWINLSSGTLGTIDGGLTAKVSSVGNGWYRASVRFLSHASATTYYVRIGTATSDAVYSFTGVLGSGIYAWGAQLEQGAFATSYISTAGATVTRSADMFYVGTTASPQGTFFTEYMPYTAPSVHTVMAYTNSSGTYFTGYGQLLRVFSATGADWGGNCCSIGTTGTFPADTITKLAGSYNTIGNRAATSANGSAVSFITHNDFTGVGTARLHLGALDSGGSQQSYGYIRKAKVYPADVSDSQLQLLTQ